MATGNSDAETATAWLFEHMEDPGSLELDFQLGAELHIDIDAPIHAAAKSSGAAGPEPATDQISMIADMGFTAAQARKALLETVIHP